MWLFCHPNTVRHRLRRITAATGRTFIASRDVAERCPALQAARQQSGRPCYTAVRVTVAKW